MAGDLFGEGTAPRVVDVRSFMDSDVPKLVGDLVAMGVLVSVGSTRDRGAISITLTNDGRWDREYFRDSADASEYLRRAVEHFQRAGMNLAVPDLNGKPLRSRARSRVT